MRTINARGTLSIRMGTGAQIETLYGDGSGNDAPAIKVLLNGGTAFDRRRGGTISAKSLKHIPPGLYRMIPKPAKEPQSEPSNC